MSWSLLTPRLRVVTTLRAFEEDGMSIQAARRMSALIAGFALVAAACGGGGDDTSGDVTLRSAGAIAVDADDVNEVKRLCALGVRGSALALRCHAGARRAPAADAAGAARAALALSLIHISEPTRPY